MAENEKHYTTHEVSRICGVAPITVGRWVRAGKLKAFRTAGGHRRIPASSLDEFLRSHGIPRSGEAENAGRRVLIVDDDPDMVEITSRQIRALDSSIEVRGAPDGFTAGRLVESFRPQLMFLDLMMPGMDGFEVLRRVKSDPSTEGVEIVGHTAYFTEENRTRLMDAGALECIRKPASAEQLRRIVLMVFEPSD